MSAPYDEDPFGRGDEGDEEPVTDQFTATGQMVMQSGLAADGTPTWRSEYSGMNQMEMLGLVTMVLVRHLFRIMMQARDPDDPDDE